MKRIFCIFSATFSKMLKPLHHMHWPVYSSNIQIFWPCNPGTPCSLSHWSSDLTELQWLGLSASSPMISAAAWIFDDSNHWERRQKYKKTHNHGVFVWGSLFFTHFRRVKGDPMMPLQKHCSQRQTFLLFSSSPNTFYHTLVIQCYHKKHLEL